MRDGRGDGAARLRQAVVDAGLVPNAAGLDLMEVLDRTRPWADEDEVAKALRRWSDRHWGTGALTPGDADSAAEVATHLAVMGRASNAPSDTQVVGIALHMLINVARGRGPTQSDLLADSVVGVPARTARRYRQLGRGSTDDPSLAAFAQFMQNLQYDLDLAALVRGGRSVGAARRWLQRHPSLHARDAPAPRARRG